MATLINRQIPALYNGVSQQPPTTRLPSQCEEMINFYPTVVDGLRRRPPSEHIARITEDDLSSAYVHLINRDATERYIVVLTDGDLKVYDLEGTEQTVTFPGGKAYLNVVDAKADFAAVTVADYTFILNKTVVVNMLAAGQDTVTQPDYYYWLSRQYPGSYLTGDLATAIQLQYAANGVGTYKGVKQSFQELADVTPVNGDVYKIQGTQESAFRSYYVRRNGGVWEETVGPNLKNAIDATTMPHALVRKGDGSFEFAPFSWAPRRVGDESTNPNPAFVGRRINDVFFYKNRLGFLVDENAVFSRAGDFGNFYRLTVLDLLDDATIDTAASETKVTKLNHAVPFDGGMMVFADQVQFRLSHGEVLKPTSAALDAVTQYNMVPVRPLPIGGDMYFAVEDGDWARLYEYYVESETKQSEATDVSGHVPRYIPAGITNITGSSSHDVVMLLTAGAPANVYVYKFHWTSETEKAQSAWGTWTFDSDASILTSQILDNSVYFIVARSDGTYLERVGLDAGARAPGLGFQIFLDRRAAVTGVYLSTEDKTRFTLPYPVPEAQRERFRIVRGPDFEGAVGAILSVDPDDYTWESPTSVTFTGDLSAGECYVGYLFESRYTFSTRYMTNQQNVPILGGSLMLVSYTVSFKDCAYFRTEIAPYGVSPDIEEIVPSQLSEFDGKVLGAASLALGEPVFSASSFRTEVLGPADVAVVTLVNDSPYASTFTQAEWEGRYNNQSRTV